MRYLLVFIYLLSSLSSAKGIDLNKVEFTAIDELENFSDSSPPAKTRRNPSKKQQKYFEPSPFRAILKPHALLHHLASQKQLQTTKKVYVYAREERPGSKNGYLLNQQKEPVYLTAMTNLISIEDDIKLSPAPIVYKKYPPRNRLMSNDKKLNLQNLFKFHQEFTSTGLIGNALGTGETLATGQRFALTTFYHNRLPFDFGITFNYQQASWSGASYWRALYLGPLIQIPLYSNSNGYLLKGSLGYEQSLFFDLTSNNESMQLSGGAFLAGLDYFFPTQFGTFTIGFSMRFLRAKIKNNLSNLPTHNRTGINSYAFTLGYAFDLQI